MRILQLIDSLRPGGAERMAVTLANALVERTEASFLCCTRLEGLFKKDISPEVEYLFLEKKYTLDPKAILRLRNLIKKNRITIIHAHSTSYFLGVLMKIFNPKLKLIWHDHYGKDLEQRKIVSLKFASVFFDGIVSVNENLKNWAMESLYCKNVIFLPNFLKPDSEYIINQKDLKANGTFKIICLANFRRQKDHQNLIQAFQIITQKNNNLSLHLIGKILNDKYYKEIKSLISSLNLEKKVFIYGEQENIEFLMKDADMGVLSSRSEGLPMALLEYGRAGLPVVCTHVGECPHVIKKNGRIVPPGNSEALASAMEFYLLNKNRREMDALAFQRNVKATYSEITVVPQLMKFYLKSDY